MLLHTPSPIQYKVLLVVNLDLILERGIVEMVYVIKLKKDWKYEE